uniref:Uncharacterized protein n=1 Tax=Anguilla anguilla TaxID=7936 RepID=A0A0E9RT31_ANGAN
MKLLMHYRMSDITSSIGKRTVVYSSINLVPPQKR